MASSNYINDLTGYLSNLTSDERNDVIDFYNEYILDANLTNDDEIIAKLGTAKQLARKILADYSIKAVDNETAGEPHYEPKPKKNIRMIWLVILAIFAAPIALPVAIAIIASIGGLMIAVLAVVLTIIICIATFFAVGILLALAGITIWSQSLATGLLFVGGGLALIGITLVGLPIAYLIIKSLIQMTANFSKFLYNRFVSSRNSAKEVD